LKTRSQKQWTGYKTFPYSVKNNQFRGQIPATIGNISGINQIDLSGNNFTGEIPASLAILANLSSFNVSYNNLSGPVPSLLSKKFNSSSFVGNLQLCGYSSSTPCPSPSLPPHNLPAPSKEASKQHRHKLSTNDIILLFKARTWVEWRGGKSGTSGP
jgi:hypothetical protein